MSTRVSTAQIYQGGQMAIERARDKETATAEKANTLKEVVRPSQNPSGWMTSTALKDQNNYMENVAKNGQLGMSLLNATENVLAQIQDYVQRGHEIAIATSGTDVGAQAARQTMVTEARTLLENAVSSANTRFANRTLLAGTKTQGPAFDANGSYIGDDGDFRIEIDRNQKIPINLRGSKALGGEGVENGVDVMDCLKRLADGIANNDIETIRSTLTDFDKANEQMGRFRAILGGRMSQIDARIKGNEEFRIQNTDIISKTEDADASKVFSDLARDEAVLRASLSTNQKILNEDPSNMLFK